MPYCLACGKLRDTVNGWCRQCSEDELMRKHPGWKPKSVVLEEQKRKRSKQEDELLI